MFNTTSFAKKKKNDKTAATLETQSVFIQGIQDYLLGKNQEAIKNFNEVLKKDPKNDVVYYQLCKIAFEAGNTDKAILFAQTAIKLNPTNAYYYQYLAEAKGEKNDFEGAAKAYETLLRYKPKEYDFYYDWAYMLTKANKLKEAIDVYNQIEQKTGISEELIFQKQPIFIKLGKIENAIQDLEKLITLFPTETRYIGLIGEIYEANKLYDKAIESYNRILALDSNNAEGTLALAEVYRKKGDIVQHETLMEKIFANKNIDIDTKIVAFIPYIEKMTKDTSLQKEVLNMADRILMAHPNNVKAITAKADVLYNMNKKEEANVQYVKAINMADVPSTVWTQLYILNAELENYDSLIVYSEKGIKENPNDLFGYFYNALANQQKKKLKEATTSLLNGFKLQEQNKENIALFTPQLKLQMLILLGDISYELKNYNLSDSAYESALEIDPNNPTLLNNYAYYLSERETSNLEKAEKMSKKSNLLLDNNSAFIDTYAWIMFKMRNYSEALDWIEQAMQLPDAPNRAELLSHYGDILFKIGKIEKAVEQWKLAIDKGGDKTILERKIKNKNIE